MIELDKKQRLALELLRAIKQDNGSDNYYSNSDYEKEKNIEKQKILNKEKTIENKNEPKRNNKRHYHPELKAKINNKEYDVLDFSISGAKIKIDLWDFSSKNSNEFFAVFQLRDKTTFVKCRGMWIDRQNKEMGIKFLSLSETSWSFFNDILFGMVKSQQQKPQQRKKFWGIF